MAQLGWRAAFRERALVPLGALWLLLCLAFLADVESPTVFDATLLALVALLLVGAGRFLSIRCAPIRPTPIRPQLQLTLMAVGGGIAAGTVILAAEVGLAHFDQGIQASFTRFHPEAWSRPFERAFPAAVMEEVIARFVLMTAVAVIAMRYLVSGDRAYLIALITSSVIFGLLHGPSPNAVGLALLMLNTAGGFLLGWIFWHWGLTQSIMCHFVGGVVIQSLGPRLLA